MRGFDFFFDAIGGGEWQCFGFQPILDAVFNIFSGEEWADLFMDRR